MPAQNVILQSKRTQALGAVAAGATVQTTSIIDMQDFNSCVFDVLVGTLTAGQTLGTLQVQGGNAANGSDMANLVAAVLTVPDAAASKMLCLEVFRANYRYLQLVFTRSTQSAQIGGIVATQYHLHRSPQPDDATCVLTLLAVEPQYSQTYYSTTTTVPTGAPNTSVVSTYRNAS